MKVKSILGALLMTCLSLSGCSSAEEEEKRVLDAIERLDKEIAMYESQGRNDLHELYNLKGELQKQLQHIRGN